MILVVDDNASNQYVARVLLQRFGYESEVADNGEEAIQAVSTRDYDLILMDCRMPVVDGYEATEAIRRLQSDRGRRVPIIGVTACAMEGDRERCFAAGMDDYYTKPLTIAGFEQLLNRWMRKTR